MQVSDEFIGVEVLARTKDMSHKHSPRFCELFAPDLEKLSEFLDRRIGCHHRRPLIALHFGPDSHARLGTKPAPSWLTVRLANR
jgi:hypothetical protein